MPTTCAIVNCHNRSGRDQKNFYRIPKVICHQGEDTQRKSERRRRLWLAAINRSDMKTCDQLRVCSDHFLSGKPHLYDETNPDYVPSINLGYDSVKLPVVSAVRHERLQKRKESIKATEAAISLLELNASFAIDTGADVCGPLPESDCVNTNTEISDTEKLKFANIEILESHPPTDKTIFRETESMDNVKDQCQQHESVYLDFNATTPLAPEVLTAINDALLHAWGNPSSSHVQGLQAKNLITEARRQVSLMIGGKPSDLIFTSGGTESNNWIFHTAIKYYLEVLQPEIKKHSSHTKICLPHFVSSNLEHDSVKCVLEHLVEDGLADCTFVPASKTSGRVEVQDIVAALRENTVLVSIMLANNETGVIQPVQEICSAVRKLKRNPGETSRILLHTDAAQAIGKIPVDVIDLQVDYLTVVGHKFYGPRIGAVYVQDLEKGTPLYPMLYGGGQERNYRPGTENTGMIAGLGKAAQLVVRNLASYEKHLREVRNYLEDQLKKEFGDMIHINGKFDSSERLPNTCNFSFLGPGLEGHKVLKEAQHLQASVGAACHEQNRVSPILLATGIAEEVARNALRLSVGRSTSMAHIDLVIKDLRRCIEILKRKTTE